jgi:hypothetical protein
VELDDEIKYDLFEVFQKLKVGKNNPFFKIGRILSKEFGAPDMLYIDPNSYKNLLDTAINK